MRVYSTVAGLAAAARRPWRCRAVAVLAVISMGLAGCSVPYDPPVQGDHASARYKADLGKCRSESAERVRIKNADTPTTWIKSAFTGPSEVRAAIRACMQAKGYPLVSGAPP